MNPINKQRHIRVEFHGYPPLDYRAERLAAELFMESARNRGMRVFVDDDVEHTMRPLPCRRLWTS